MNKNKGFDPRSVCKTLKTDAGEVTIASFKKAAKVWGDPSSLPFSIRILLESAVRNCDNYQITLKDIENIMRWKPDLKKELEIAFKPGRVILQDYTGVPCIVDLAAMRSAMKELGGDIKKINPQVQCDLTIDHSMQVDFAGSKQAFGKNLAMEFRRNKERYEFLKWGQNAFHNFAVVPPATGIIHQVNLEYLAKGVLRRKQGKATFAFPDSLVGTDSHTTMINGLGIVGWGVGGIEAEAVMLGEPIYMLLPEVIGFELTGEMVGNVTATDVVLTVTEMLRKKGVVGKFVEFYGEGIKGLSLPDRATISNMAPEYGATIGIFPVDEETLAYYRLSGRKPAEVDLVERYMKEQGLFYVPKQAPVSYSDTLKLDLSTVVPCVAGPKRPQDRIPLTEMKTKFKQTLTAPLNERGYSVSEREIAREVSVSRDNKEVISHGSVVLASITSCTNTSNPSVLIGAGLLAKKAVEKGLRVKEFVKTSFIPGSQVAADYLTAAGLLPFLEKLNFHIVGYGCATCIGNSGPLAPEVTYAVQSGNLVAAGVLSGNRNFEGRISPHVKANFLASPAMVIAYALAGTVNIDMTRDAIGNDKKGQPVYLQDIWPAPEEIKTVINKYVKSSSFKKCYKDATQGDENWAKIKSVKSDLFNWDRKSTYIQEPPFFDVLKGEGIKVGNIENARALAVLGDSVTTDHISPAGSINPESSAGKYLIGEGVDPKDFNSYGARRGNDKVMTRGTFANIRLRNRLAPGKEGSWTIHFPSGNLMTIYDAAMEYKKDNIPLVILAGKEYGTGSSRDWAAKGTALLGVKAVIAESFERIHRSNLAGMGILPLQFEAGDSAEKLGLTGEEVFTFENIDAGMKPRASVTVTATSPNGDRKEFVVTARLDTPVEIDYYKNGGILPTVLKKLL
jgi:aconitate hydratase